MKPSTRRSIRTVLQVVIGLAAAIPIFMIDAGIETDVGAGATIVVIAAAVGKAANLAEDQLEE